MGIAERIAMIMIVMANSLAIFPRVFTSGQRREDRRSDAAVFAQALFSFEREVGRRWFTASHRHFLGLLAVLLLPGRYRVTARRNVLDGVRTVGVSRGIGTFDDNVPAVHPGMDVALHRNRYFFRLPTRLDGRRPGRL